MNRIKDLREDRDLRQIDVASATGIDQRTLSNYETGKTNPDSYAIIQLAKFFNVSCDYLLGVPYGDEAIEKDLNDILQEVNDIQKRLKKVQQQLEKRIKKE